MWQAVNVHVDPFGPENADADHSAKVRSICPPAGEAMSWHVPHMVALSLCPSSWKRRVLRRVRAVGDRVGVLAAHHEVAREVDGAVVVARCRPTSIVWQKKHVTPL